MLWRKRSAAGHELPNWRDKLKGKLCGAEFVDPRQVWVLLVVVGEVAVNGELGAECGQQKEQFFGDDSNGCLYPLECHLVVAWGCRPPAA